MHTLLGPLAAWLAAGHAAVSAAGPWLFTIFALASIGFIADQITGREVLSNFRAIVIYSFATSLVMAAPITIVATRLVGDALWLKRPQDVRGLLLGSYVAVIPAIIIGVLTEVLLLGVETGAAIALGGISLLVALIWVALAFCGAVRDSRGVTISFIAGLAIALMATIGVASRSVGGVARTRTFRAATAAVGSRRTRPAAVAACT